MTKFSNFGKDNRDNMETFQVALGECDLLTLANGQRTVPILTTRNPGGYSEKTLIFKDDGSYDVIPADDIYKRVHDLKRLKVILNVVTGKDLHYLIKHVLTENDSVQWFKIIYDHINGTKNSDIRKATDQLHQLKLKPTQSIQENVANIEEAFRVLNVASGVTITDDQKLYHLQEKLEHDVRVSVLSTMASAKTSAESYDITVKRLIILDPAPTTAHKMASITTSKELCRRHIAGLCTNGTQCKYSHAPAPSVKGAPPIPKPNVKSPPPHPKNDGKTGTGKTPYKPPFKKHLVVSEDHRALVGYPRGKPSNTNPAGYSLNQLTSIRTLQSADTDGWATGDPDYFNGSASVPHTERFNVLEQHRHIRGPGRAVGHMVSMYPAVYHLDPFPLITDIKLIIQTIRRSITTYNKSISNIIDLTQDDVTFAMTGLVAYLSSSSTSQQSIRLFVAFTWLSDIPSITDAFRIRHDVRNGSKDLMRVLYKIGNRFLDANIDLPDKDVATDASYMTFNPSSSIYYHPDVPGHYQSTMKNIERYFTAAEYVHQNVTHIATSDIMNLALVYDFMSYAALNIRDTISSGRTLVQSKNSMKFTLSQYEESPTHSHHGQFHRAFRAIVDNIKTAPPPPDMQKMIPTQSPIVFSRMSAPQAEDLMSETTTQSPARNDSDEEYEEYESDTGEEASVADSIERERLKDIVERSDGNLKFRHPERFEVSSIKMAGDDPARRSMSSASSKRPPSPEKKRRKSEADKESPPPQRKRTSFEDENVVDITSPTPTAGSHTSSTAYESSAPDSSPYDVQPAISPLAEKSPKKMKPSKSSFKKSPTSTNANLKLLTVTNQKHSIMSMSNDADRIIIDSGASTSGTGLKSKLINIKPTSCSMTAAFGESLQPTETGLLPPLMLETIIIDQMKATTLLSVSQACAQGLIGVFTTKDCKFFHAKDVIPHLQALSKNAIPVITGKVEDGLYLMDSK